MSNPSQLFSMKLLFLIMFVSFLGMAKSQAVDKVAPGEASELKIAVRNTGAEEPPAPASRGEFVQGGEGPSANGDPRLKTYLALHCQAVLGLPLRDFGGPYGSSACGTSQDGAVAK
jgi:hypothetical protein